MQSAPLFMLCLVDTFSLPHHLHCALSNHTGVVEDIRKLAPLLQSVIDHSSICVMGNEEKIHQDADVFDKILSLPD